MSLLSSARLRPWRSFPYYAHSKEVCNRYTSDPPFQISPSTPVQIDPIAIYSHTRQPNSRPPPISLSLRSPSSLSKIPNSKSDSDRSLINQQKVECFTNKNGEAELYQVSQPNGGGDCGKHGDQDKGRYSWIFPSGRVLLSHWFKGKLYMLLPVWESDLGTGTSTKWLSMGRTFDPHHKLIGKFKAPDSLESCGALISAYDNRYYFAQPRVHKEPSSPFQCYHLGSDTWKDLPRIPPDLRHNLHDTVASYAVCSGHILVSISNRLFAYHVHEKKWHCVSKPNRFFGIFGRAVVLGDYIYDVDSMYGLVCEITFDCTDYNLSTHVFLEGVTSFCE
ncbi:hypothetical protein ACFX12_017022 [Malus domestica]